MPMSVKPERPWTTVDLQKPFSYSLIILGILIFLVLLPWIIKLIQFIIKHWPKKKNKPEKKKVKNIAAIKSKYTKKIDKIAANESLSDREVYLELSSTVRNFVFEMTGVTAQNFSLREIKGLNMPELYDLIEQFYHPEFAAEEVETDIAAAIAGARKVVSEWK